MALLAKDLAELKSTLGSDASASVRAQPTLPATLSSSSASTSLKPEPPARTMRGFVSGVKKMILQNPDLVVLGQNRKRKEDNEDMIYFFFSTDEIVDGGKLAKEILKGFLAAEYADVLFDTTCPENGVSRNV